MFTADQSLKPPLSPFAQALSLRLSLRPPAMHRAARLRSLRYLMSPNCALHLLTLGRLCMRGSLADDGSARLNCIAVCQRADQRGFNPATLQIEEIALDIGRDWDMQE